MVTATRLARAPSQLNDDAGWLYELIGRVSLDKNSTLHIDIYDHAETGPHLVMRAFRRGEPTENVLRMRLAQIPELRSALQRVLDKAGYLGLTDYRGTPVHARPALDDEPTGKAASIANRYAE